MLQVTRAILQPEHSAASDSCQTQGMVEIQQEQGGSLWQSSSPAGRFIKTLTNTDSDCLWKPRASNDVGDRATAANTEVHKEQNDIQYLLPDVLLLYRRLLGALWWGIGVQEVWVL